MSVRIYEPASRSQARAAHVPPNAGTSQASVVNPNGLRHSLANLVDGGSAVIQRVHLAEANVVVDETDAAAVRAAMIASWQHYRIGDLADLYAAGGRSLRPAFEDDSQERLALADIFCYLRDNNSPALGAFITDIRRDGVTLKYVYEKAKARGKPYLGEIVALQVAHPALVENERQMRDIVGAVSLPSAAHKLELINTKYSQVAAHPYGFSFCATATMQADVDDINRYLGMIRHTPTAVTYEIPWQWAFVPDQRVQFTVNGRRYSTHHVPGHAQLYPLNGPGVIHGNGPVDMAKRLDAMGTLDETKKIKLYQVYCELHAIEHNPNAPAQLGNQQKAAYVAAMDLLIA